MGILYNAFREGTPLLVTVGQQDRRMLYEEPLLWGDLVGVAQPWTKSAVEVMSVQELPIALRRAVQAALTPPTGPVLLSMPLDVQMEVSDALDLTPIRLPNTRVRPPVDAVREAATLLATARSPAILAGSRVTERDATRELVALAEKIGAPVFSEPATTNGRQGFPADHPLYGQGLPLWSPEIRDRLQPFDVVFVTGMDLFRLYVYHEPARALPDDVRVIQLDEDPRQLGKNYPIDVGLIGDTKTGLADLTNQLEESMSSEQKQLAEQRGAEHAAKHERDRLAYVERSNAEIDVRPMTPLTLMRTVAEVLPENAAVVEAAVTTTNTSLQRLGALKNTTGYFAHRGWALGWGLNVAIGAKLAWPDRPVFGLIGDGSALYGIQGLWSAAHHQIPVTFVICNNAQYQILKVGAAGLKLPNAVEGRFEGLDLIRPEVDFVGLSRSLGVEALRLTEPDELAEALSESTQRKAPLVIEVPISRETPGRLDYG
jgi:benzoylformate decarboxylase